jgi:calcineurin-like phosphoesterase family protein
MGNIYVTSDLHFGHDREFIWKARGYNSIEEMNEDYVHKWNITVNDEDDVYVLGDLMLGDKSNIEYIKRLKGIIHIALGNHDTRTREEMYRELPNVVEVMWAIKLDYRKYHFLMTHFPTMTGNLEKESLRQMTLNLYGHTHQNTNFYEDRPYMYHVGVDSHDCYPVLLDDIIEEMYAKVKECVAFLDEEPAESVVPVDQSRCGKCIYEVLVCGENDFYGNCPKYKRDPPDGGFYG